MKTRGIVRTCFKIGFGLVVGRELGKLAVLTWAKATSKILDKMVDKLEEKKNEVSEDESK